MMKGEMKMKDVNAKNKYGRTKAAKLLQEADAYKNMSRKKEISLDISQMRALFLSLRKKTKKHKQSYQH